MNLNLGEPILYLPLMRQAVMSENQSYNVSGIIIPGDKAEFNKMWLDKDFDKIILDPDSLHIPHMYRENNGRELWSTYFFIRRRELQYETAEELWINSPFHSTMMREIEVLLFTYSPYENDERIPWSSSGEEVLAKKQRYLFEPATTLMFQETNKPVIYSDPQLFGIYRTLIERFQILARKTDDERICDYLDDLLEVSRRIQFIQSLCYFGLKHTIYKFKSHNNYYRISDPVIREFRLESDGFLETRYKHTLFKFYKFCVSPEKLTPAMKDKLQHFGATVLYHQDIRLLVSSYVLPMRSTVKQDKLHAICSEMVLSYLKPTCITEEYVLSKLNR
jgi:hypothetical protein